MTKLLLLTGITALVLGSCASANPPAIAPSPMLTVPPATPTGSAERTELLTQSWQAYKQRFIQSDGRVIDREANDRTVSEGQAYAMLRAVMMDDRTTFDQTLAWAESNLQRRDAQGRVTDSLWAWKWGQTAQGNWGTIDGNFASDADIDAVTALILAARRWNHPEYLSLARTKLRDLWEVSTYYVPPTSPGSSGRRYLLPGPIAAFLRSDDPTGATAPDRLVLNPSYLAPAAFRLFAEIDPERDWKSLVNSSYEILEGGAAISKLGLPSDWIVLNLSTRNLEPAPPDLRLQSVYSFDAYRVWWRVGLDAVWYREPRALAFLQTHLEPLKKQWQTAQKVPARIDLEGQAIVPYESTAQYAMLYAGFVVTDSAIASQIEQQKLIPTYQNGFWDSDIAYYTQNLVWFGLAFPYGLTAQ
ncbi:glycosyl hydrolase family 8 [Leptolyngbya ohadii]|uniref:glycosyl hydrolase family 8 n=1 Tax=Leptolyngbya ohadii TaxID=1962290 RepID=UPI000B598726|nr:glycosyl hydrolase family 8 [Leptolyngbya ohadii]